VVGRRPRVKIICQKNSGGDEKMGREKENQSRMGDSGTSVRPGYMGGSWKNMRMILAETM